MKKIIIPISLVMLLVVFAFSFIPALETYQLYKFDQRNEQRIGDDGPKFTDSDGRRCLVSESDGFRCPATSSGYNADTGKYVMGKPTIDQLTGKTSMYDDDPYDNINHLSDEAMMQILSRP